MGYRERRSGRNQSHKKKKCGQKRDKSRVNVERRRRDAEADTSDSGGGVPWKFSLKPLGSLNALGEMHKRGWGGTCHKCCSIEIGSRVRRWGGEDLVDEEGVRD